MNKIYKFHFLNGISEINQLFDDILIIWLAPVYQFSIPKVQLQGIFIKYIICKCICNILKYTSNTF